MNQKKQWPHHLWRRVGATDRRRRHPLGACRLHRCGNPTRAAGAAAGWQHPAAAPRRGGTLAPCRRYRPPRRAPPTRRARVPVRVSLRRSPCCRGCGRGRWGGPSHAASVVPPLPPACSGSWCWLVATAATVGCRVRGTERARGRAGGPADVADGVVRRRAAGEQQVRRGAKERRAGRERQCGRELRGGRQRRADDERRVGESAGTGASAGGLSATLSSRHTTRCPLRGVGNVFEYRAPAGAAAGHGGVPAAVRARHDVCYGRLGARLSGARRWRVRAGGVCC